MNNPSGLVLPDSAGVLVTPPPRVRDVADAGPFKVGQRIPLYGYVLLVTKILANEEDKIKLVLEPVDVTAGAVKRARGKKGKKHGRRVHTVS